MMKTLLAKYWPALVFGVAVSLSYYWGTVNECRDWEVRWNSRNAEEAEAIAALQAAHRQKEQELQDELQNQLAASDARRLEMQRVQSDADRNAERLHEQIASLRDKLSRTSSLTSDSGSVSPATRAAMVLTDLYGSCVVHRRELASAVDESRQRGLEVEQMYNRARGQ